MSAHSSRAVVVDDTRGGEPHDLAALEPDLLVDDQLCGTFVDVVATRFDQAHVEHALILGSERRAEPGRVQCLEELSVELGHAPRLAGASWNFSALGSDAESMSATSIGGLVSE